jgi:sugar lactone lactonase YvrE
MKAWAGRSVAITAALLLGGSCGGANTASPSPPATAATSSSAQQATLVAPEAFALAPDGAIYVSDCEAQRIFRLGSDGAVEVVAGSGPEGFENGDFAGDGGPATEARLNCPGGLAVDEAGNLFVADAINNRIRMIDAHGTITTVAGSGPAGLDRGGIGGDGGPATKARFEFPAAIAFDARGDLLVSDHGNDEIRAINPDGVITTIAGVGVGGFAGDGGPATEASLHGPWYLAVDERGDVIFADKENGRVRMIDRGGIITTIAGGGSSQVDADGAPATDVSLSEPYGVAIDADGNLYVSDDLDNVVMMIDTQGKISTIAGTGSPGDGGDGGPAADAQLDSPFGLLVDMAGALYIADGGNGRVRVVDTGGIISSVLGSR